MAMRLNLNLHSAGYDHMIISSLLFEVCVRTFVDLAEGSTTKLLHDSVAFVQYFLAFLEHISMDFNYNYWSDQSIDQGLITYLLTNSLSQSY